MEISSELAIFVVLGFVLITSGIVYALFGKGEKANYGNKV